jgi:hypothetical protein
MKTAIALASCWVITNAKSVTSVKRMTYFLPTKELASAN